MSLVNFVKDICMFPNMVLLITFFWFLLIVPTRLVISFKSKIFHSSKATRIISHKLNADYSAIVVTSPSPQNPDTSMILSVIQSICFSAGTNVPIPVLIFCDGL